MVLPKHWLIQADMIRECAASEATASSAGKPSFKRPISLSTSPSSAPSPSKASQSIASWEAFERELVRHQDGLREMDDCKERTKLVEKYSKLTTTFLAVLNNIVTTHSPLDSVQ
jgi:hypothetical protein